MGGPSNWRRLGMHNASQPGFGIFQVLLQDGGALLEFSSAEKLVHLAVHWDQSTRIVVTAIDKDHAHTQGADYVLIKGFKPLVVVKPD